MIVRTDPLADIFPETEKKVIPVEKPLDLGALARIHRPGKTPPASSKIVSLEFMFLQDEKWLRYDSGSGKIIPISDEQLKMYSDTSKYLLLGPESMEEGKKIGVYDFLLYELDPRTFYR